jgi:hypothetical protein
MRLFFHFSALLIVVVTASADLGAQGPPATPAVEFGSGKVDLPRGETTEVKGKIPVNLAGLWLVEETHDLPGKGEEKRRYPVLQLYQVAAEGDGGLRLNLVAFTPPPAVDEKLAQARAAQKGWQASADDLKAIVGSLRADPPRGNPQLRGMHLVSAAAEFAPAAKSAPESKGASFAVQSLFQPDGRPTYGQSYYFTKTSKDELSGTFTMGAVVQGVRSVPIPIGTTGKFRWIRLDLPRVTPTVPKP